MGAKENQETGLTSKNLVIEKNEHTVLKDRINIVVKTENSMKTAHYPAKIPLLSSSLANIIKSPPKKSSSVKTSSSLEELSSGQQKPFSPFKKYQKSTTNDGVSSQCLDSNAIKLEPLSTSHTSGEVRALSEVRLIEPNSELRSATSNPIESHSPRSIKTTLNQSNNSCRKRPIPLRSVDVQSNPPVSRRNARERNRVKQV